MIPTTILFACQATVIRCAAFANLQDLGSRFARAFSDCEHYRSVVRRVQHCCRLSVFPKRSRDCTQAWNQLELHAACRRQRIAIKINKIKKRLDALLTDEALDVLVELVRLVGDPVARRHWNHHVAFACFDHIDRLVVVEMKRLSCAINVKHRAIGKSWGLRGLGEMRKNFKTFATKAQLEQQQVPNHPEIRVINCACVLLRLMIWSAPRRRNELGDAIGNRTTNNRHKRIDQRAHC